MINHARHDFIELTFIYFVAISLLLILSSFTKPVSTARLGIIAPKESKTEIVYLFDKEAFKSLPLRARAYVVYDIVNAKIISGKNENEVLPLASITKVMMAVTAHIHHEKSSLINIGVLPNGYDLGLNKNQTWNLDELLKYVLVFSSNDGTEAIAKTFGGKDAFVKQMNLDAINLGLNMRFSDPSGLDASGLLGGQGSALDTAKLFAIARKKFPEILDATTKTRVNVNASTGRIIGIPNTNQTIEEFIGVEASKTGFTESAGGNLAIIVDVTVGHPVVIVVLGSTHEERFTDMQKLYKALQKSVGK